MLKKEKTTPHDSKRVVVRLWGGIALNGGSSQLGSIAKGIHSTLAGQHNRMEPSHTDGCDWYIH